MNDLDFKLTLIKALEHNANTQSAFNTEGIWKIISSLPLCKQRCTRGTNKIKKKR